MRIPSTPRLVSLRLDRPTVALNPASPIDDAPRPGDEINMSHIDYALFEAPVGYAVFKVVHQADAVGLKMKEVQEAATDLAKFGKMLKLVNFTPFE